MKNAYGPDDMWVYLRGKQSWNLLLCLFLRLIADEDGL